MLTHAANEENLGVPAYGGPTSTPEAYAPRDGLRNRSNAITQRER